MLAVETAPVSAAICETPELRQIARFGQQQSHVLRFLTTLNTVVFGVHTEHLQVWTMREDVSTRPVDSQVSRLREGGHLQLCKELLELGIVCAW